MKKKVLLGNNISEIYKNLKKCFRKLDMSITNCPNNKKSIINHLEEDKYDILIFFAPDENKGVLEFVEEVRTKFPELKIYCIFYFMLETEKREMLQKGVRKCFTIGENENMICYNIISEFYREENFNFSLEISDFLVTHGFPCYLNGFYFICMCIQYFIENPDTSKNFSKYVYPVIEKERNVSTSWIERSIRYISHVVYKNGVFFEYYPTEKPLNNKSLINALVSEFNKCKKK